MHKKIHYYLRGANNILRYLFKELPRGVDFSLRDLKTSYSGNHGYALTTKKSLANILKNIDLKGKRFLDIGSGKGGPICYAFELGAKNCQGLEYEEKLHNKAEKNIKRLNIQDNVKSVNIDARLFKKYEEFDIYFMFNPFDDDIYETVFNSIMSQNQSIKSDKYLIAYGGANTKILNYSDRIELFLELQCPNRKNRILIYKFVKSNH